MKKMMSVVLAGVVMVSVVGCSSSVKPQETTAAETKAVKEATVVEEKETTAEAAVSEWTPTSVISLVLPASPGGTVDLSARLWAQYVKEVCGWDAVVVNSAGASGSVAANAVLGSAADGYTVLYGHNLVNVANVAGITDYNYEAFTLGPNFSEEPIYGLLLCNSSGKYVLYPFAGSPHA